MANCHTYTIKKNKHYAKGLNLKPLFLCTHMEHNVKFHKSCLYNLQSVDQYDINKLFGISFGHHHWNSVRFGWRTIVGTAQIEIVAYIYKRGHRVRESEAPIVICKIETDEYYRMAIDYNYGDSKYSFKVYRDSEVLGYQEFDGPETAFPFGYKLYPYFGGNNPAPHEMKIQLC